MCEKLQPACVATGAAITVDGLVAVVDAISCSDEHQRRGAAAELQVSPLQAATADAVV